MGERWMETCRKLFAGEVKVNKRDLWLIGGICLFAGIVYGLRKAPWTHGVAIGSNKGNNSGSNNGYPAGCCCEDAEDEACCEEADAEEGCCCR